MEHRRGWSDLARGVERTLNYDNRIGSTRKKGTSVEKKGLLNMLIQCSTMFHRRERDMDETSP